MRRVNNVEVAIESVIRRSIPVVAKSGGLEDLLAEAVQQTGSDNNSQNNDNAGATGTNSNTGTSGIVIEETDRRSIQTTAKSGGLEDLLAEAVQQTGSDNNSQNNDNAGANTNTGTNSNTSGIVIEETDRRSIQTTAKSGK